MKTSVGHRRILHVITGLGDGGAEGMLYRLCAADSSSTHAVVSLTDEGKYGERLRAVGISVWSLNMLKGRPSVGPLLRIVAVIRQFRPTTVQTWLYHADLVGGLVARACGVKNVVWNLRHANLVPGETPRATVLIAKVCAFLSRWVPRRIVYCAEAARVVHVAAGYEHERMIYIGNGYDFHGSAALTGSSDIGAEFPFALKPTVGVIGFVARFDALKDHQTLLDALVDLRGLGREPTCILAGTGMTPENEELVEMVESRGLTSQVLLLGRVSDALALMRMLDVHVSSSISEAFPNVLAEAMSVGTPCITTDVGAAAEIVGDTGWVVPVRRPELLATTIDAALRSKDEDGWSERQGACMRRVRDRYSISAVLTKYHETVWS